MIIQTESKRIVLFLQDRFNVSVDASEESYYRLDVDASFEDVISCFEKKGYVLEEILGTYHAKTR